MTGLIQMNRLFSRSCYEIAIVTIIPRPISDNTPLFIQKFEAPLMGVTAVTLFAKARLLFCIVSRKTKPLKLLCWL
jgi:hypothetical protein